MKTYIQLHGILAREYDGHFEYELGNPKNVLQAIDTNRKGFINRIIELEKQGFCYDIIIDKKRVIHAEEMEQFKNPKTIDLVPAITGSGVVATVVGSIVSFLGTSGLVATLVKAVIFAAVAYALTPTPEPEEALEIEAKGSRTSMIFSNTVNTASQGSPVPLGYGRLKVGSQVIQATIKSYPQSQRVRDALRGVDGQSRDKNEADAGFISNKRFGAEGA